MISVVQVVWVVIFLSFNVPLVMIRDRMSREVNIHTVGGGRQFHVRQWWTWGLEKDKALWKLHHRYYPKSRLRLYYGACYGGAMVWVIVAFLLSR